MKEEDDKVRAWRKQFGVKYPLAMDERGNFHASLVPPRVLPTTIVFTPSGMLGPWWYGSTGRSRLEVARAEALGLPAPSASPGPDDDDEVYTPAMKPSPSPAASASPNAQATPRP